MSTDRELRRRWEPAFEKAGWPAVSTDDIAALVGALQVGAAAALAMVDAEQLSREGAKALGGLRRSKVHFIVFGRKDRNDDAAIIKCLDAGADDFFDAATDPLLVVAKLRAHLRRSEERAPSGPLLSPKKRLKVDLGARSVWRKVDNAWQEVRLTARETSLLELFLRNPGKVLERSVIMERVWGGPAGEVNPETVDKHVESLRKKLGDSGAGLQTIWGTGYALKE